MSCRVHDPVKTPIFPVLSIKSARQGNQLRDSGHVLSHMLALASAVSFPPGGVAHFVIRNQLRWSLYPVGWLEPRSIRETAGVRKACRVHARGFALLTGMRNLT